LTKDPLPFNKGDTVAGESFRFSF